MSRPDENAPFPARYIPLCAWLIVVGTLLLIPLRIISYGFLPDGDARRHVAKAFTDRPYTDILLMRPGYTVDHSPGWEWLLRVLHRQAGVGLDGLVSFSVTFLMLCILLAPLPWVRRPEAWLAALLAELVAIPELMTRFSQARPFLLTEGILIAVLFAWSKPDEKTPSRTKLTLTCLGVALSVWMHGAWYLWVLPLLGFAMARAWRSGVWLAGCIAAGVVAGALLTGRPVDFLYTAVFMAGSISGEHLPQWMLVGEFRPSYGEFSTVVLIAVVMIWRKLQCRELPDLFRQPVFCVLALCWVFGFKADRFWADWGMPATLVWLTMQFDELLPAFWDAASLKRVAACVLLALPVFLTTTNDLDRRYTSNLDEFFLDASDPSLKGWLPDGNGIFYSAQMGFFYNTFYKNPGAEWRYIVGYEPALAPDEDRKILRQIQWNHYAFKAYEPWIKKMRPEDRLEIDSGSQPNLPQLEWHNAVGYLWIGRLPRQPLHK
jgi:hypothetical protein